MNKTPRARLRSGATALAAVVALTMGLAACGSSFDREGAVEELMDGGLSEEQANCAVDAMIEEFGEDKLASDDDPTDEEQAIVIDIVSDCVLG